MIVAERRALFLSSLRNWAAELPQHHSTYQFLPRDDADKSRIRWSEAPRKASLNRTSIWIMRHCQCHVGLISSRYSPFPANQTSWVLGASPPVSKYQRCNGILRAKTLQRCYWHSVISISGNLTPHQAFHNEPLLSLSAEQNSAAAILLLNAVVLVLNRNADTKSSARVRGCCQMQSQYRIDIHKDTRA